MISESLVIEVLTIWRLDRRALYNGVDAVADFRLISNLIIMPRAALSKSFCLGRIQIQQNVKHAKVLQYDSMTGDLRVWFWYVLL